MKDDDGKAEPALLAWAKFRSAKTDAEVEQVAMEDPALKQAKEALERLSADRNARIMAERRETALRLHNVDMAVAREEGRNEGWVDGKVEGRAEGEVIGQALILRELILTQLARRGLTVTDELRSRIETCEDVARLKACFERVLVADRIEEVFV